MPRWERRARQQLCDQEIGGGRHADYANANVLRRIISEHGWPDARLVGEDGARAAYLIALHADAYLIVQQVADRAMHGAVQRGAAPVREWVRLHDRHLLNSGAPQLFGTQYRLGAGGWELQPVREPEKLDARRAGVGLPPAAEALNNLRRRLSAQPPSAVAPHDDPPTANLTVAA
ncbi:DUF6624 domain-containing protein [Streptomyces microflavus]|uniref:DUF6624 domain-containing protein n=1 Tax=Streptomyces microflavus TaxID=1919 RepID=UPI0033BE17D3